MGLSTNYCIILCCLLHAGYIESGHNELSSTSDNPSLAITSTITNMTLDADAEIIEEDFTFTCHKGLNLLRFATVGVIVVIMSVVGVISNTLLFLVSFKLKYNQSTNLIIRVLAVIDMFIVVSCVVTHSIRIITSCGLKWDFYRNNHVYIFAVFYPIMFCIRTMSIWLATLLTVDRWQAICQPQNRHCTHRQNSTIFKLICVLCGAIIVSLPRFFEYRLVSGTSLKEADMTTNLAYTIVYKINLFFLCTYLIPMILMAVFNTKLICILKRGQSDAKKSRSITLTVILIVVIFMVCNIPPMVSHLLWSLETAFPSLSHLERHRRPMTNITNVLVVVNSVVNFFVYYVCSKSFRGSVSRLFRCQTSEGDTENSQSGATNMSGCSSTEKLNMDTTM